MDEELEAVFREFQALSMKDAIATFESQEQESDASIAAIESQGLCVPVSASAPLAYPGIASSDVLLTANGSVLLSKERGNKSVVPSQADIDKQIRVKVAQIKPESAAQEEEKRKKKEEEEDEKAIGKRSSSHTIVLCCFLSFPHFDLRLLTVFLFLFSVDSSFLMISSVTCHTRARTIFLLAEEMRKIHEEISQTDGEQGLITLMQHKYLEMVKTFTRLITDSILHKEYEGNFVLTTNSSPCPIVQEHEKDGARPDETSGEM
jgi:hypothetical protein